MIVFLHGFTGSPTSWAPVTGLLAPNTPVLAPSLVGHGHRGSLDGTFEGEVDRLAAIIEKQTAPACLVGYSLGARLALGILVRHPGLVPRAVLIGANPGLESEPERESRRAADEKQCALLTEQGIEAFVKSWESLPLFASQASLPAAALEAQRTVRSKHDPQELASSLRSTGLGRMPSYWGDLANVTARVAVVAGERDPKFRNLAERMVALLPVATLHVVHGAGHNVVLESPSEIAALVQSLSRSVA